MTEKTGRKKEFIQRHWTESDPYEGIEWEERTARIGSEENPVFEQHGVEVPSFWSQNATNIVAQKYFAYGEDDPRRETSVREMIDRVVDKIASEGSRLGYFRRGEEAIFAAELKYILVHQLASFNSPVWFNIGVEGAPQTSSACFILALEDTLESITTWYSEEAKIFQAGSGSGINLSPLRGAGESLSRGGASSGPVTFMRAADASAGTIQSGGVTRRAAKMVILDDDHPDVEDFIWCKAREEERIHALRAAGFDMSMDSRAMAESTSYQNANQSVRLSDEFMKAVAEDGEWSLRARKDGSATKTLPARKLLREIAEAAWACADPGVQYNGAIQSWHTTPAQGPITASNPCSEFLSNNNTSCNLASLNLLRFLRSDSTFDIEGFRHSTRMIFLAQEITIAFADFPTKKIGKMTRALRQIGIGYSNLGALLMSLGLPYDSEPARNWTAALTALLTGEAYLYSTEIAERMGPFDYFEENSQSMKDVLGKHKKHANKLPAGKDTLGDIVRAAKASWRDACRGAEESGVRNAQASVLAPTGTISFMMDCDTTGIEPDFSLIKHKTLVGGGHLAIANASVPRALRTLGYSQPEIDDMVAYLEEEEDQGGGISAPRGTLEGAPHLREEDLPVFDCAVGSRAISPSGHIEMMAAAQPFLSGAISKTVNVPAEASVDDIYELYSRGWELGLKALAIYRDGSKANQPLAEKRSEDDQESLLSLLGDGLRRGERREVPREAQVVGTKFEIRSSSQPPVSGYIHVRLFEDSTPGSIFVDVGQAGSTLHGFIRAWSVTLGLALQYGMPLDVLVSKLAFAQFEPAGLTDDKDIRNAKSIVDYVVRWLALHFLDSSVFSQLGIMIDTAEPEVIPGGEVQAQPEIQSPTRPAVSRSLELTALYGVGVCDICSGQLVRTGACTTCLSCGNSGGCG